MSLIRKVIDGIKYAWSRECLTCIECGGPLFLDMPHNKVRCLEHQLDRANAKIAKMQQVR